MRRRKKKPSEESPAPENTPPLQPVYPESEPESESQPESPEPIEVAEPNEPSAEAEVAETAQPERARPKRRRKKRPAKQASEVTPEAVGEDAGEAGNPVEPDQEVPAAAVAQPVDAPLAVEKPVPPIKARSSKGAVVLAVGLPGSGKSTWFKRHAVTPLSSDMVRHLLFDNPTEQRYQDLVFGTLRSLLRARLIAKMPMNYVDATNLSPKERRHWIRMAKDFGYEAHAVYFDVPLEVCIDRNRRRNRVVPEDVMQRMSAKLRPPTFDEGFAKIIVVRVKSKADGAEQPVPSE